MMYTSQNVMLLVSYNLMFHVFLQYLCYYSNGSEIYIKLKLTVTYNGDNRRQYIKLWSNTNVKSKYSITDFLV